MDERQMRAFLKGEVEFLSFRRLLEELYGGKVPVQRYLIDRLTGYEERGNREATARKVRNWMQGRNLPENREELFKICFALDFTPEQAECVLCATAENGIHYRNPRELIYSYCLKNHVDYPAARQMVGELWKEPLPEKNLELKKRTEDTSSSESPSRYTASVRNQWKRVKTEDDLKKFLAAYKEDFGCHHNTAYRKFQKMLSCLLQPDSPEGSLGEQSYSVEQVVEEYLRMGIPYGRKGKGYTRLQKEIKRHWPSAKTIRAMVQRKLDVDRKTLLLLYLATEGMAAEANEGCEQWLDEHHKGIDLMMTECGMAILNPHAPFDYLVVQAIRKEHEEETMSWRMEWMLGRLFSRKHPVAYIR